MKPMQTVLLSTKQMNAMCNELSRLKEEKEILIKVVVRHKPELEGWIKKNFRRVEREQIK